MNIVDGKSLTALDTVRDMPSQKSRQIAALIQGTSGPDLTHISESEQHGFHTRLLSKAHMSGRPSETSLPPPPVPPPQESLSPKRKGQRNSSQLNISHSKYWVHFKAIISFTGVS